MGEKITNTANEYNPLADAASLIGDVLDRPVDKTSEKVITLPNDSEESKEETIDEVQPEPNRDKEKLVTIKAMVPKSDIVQARRVLESLRDELGADFNMSQLIRGWLTRLVTAEKELIDVAKNYGPLKTPNRRDRTEIIDMDYTLAEIQSIAFRRAKPIR